MAIIVIPEVLREKLGKNGADALAKVLSQVENDSNRKVIGLMENRFERRLAEEMGLMRSEFHQSMGEFKAEIHQSMSEFKAEIHQSMSEFKAEIRSEMMSLKSEMIKWMFLFWIGQATTIIGFCMIFVKP